MKKFTIIPINEFQLTDVFIYKDVNHWIQSANIIIHAEIVNSNIYHQNLGGEQADHLSTQFQNVTLMAEVHLGHGILGEEIQLWYFGLFCHKAMKLFLEVFCILQGQLWVLQYLNKYISH